MAKQVIDRAADALLKDEFQSIVTKVEDLIASDSEYAFSQEFISDKQRMTQLMVKIEGCGCGGRSEMLTSMFTALSRGQKGVFKTFGALVIRSFAVDIKKAFKIL